MCVQLHAIYSVDEIMLSNYVTQFYCRREKIKFLTQVFDQKCQKVSRDYNLEC